MEYWSVLTFEVPDRDADELVGMVGETSLGAELIPLSGSSCRVRIYLSAKLPARTVVASVETLLERRGLAAADCNVRLSRIADGRWAERYQAGLRPFPLGRGFSVFPSEPAQATGDRSPILLVPGRAFGTGDHETTQLCAEAVERSVVPGSRWLDVGCGSAILSIVLRRCGATTVLAVDNDPEAVDVAREVLGRNGLAGQVEVRRGSTADCPRDCWDGVVANIGSSFFVEQAAAIRRLLTPGGTLLAAGFLHEDVASITRSLENAGLLVRDQRARAEWALIEARGTPPARCGDPG